MMWHDEGAWIAIGISLLFLVAALVMHRVFVTILKTPPPKDGEAAMHNKELPP